MASPYPHPGPSYYPPSSLYVYGSHSPGPNSLQHQYPSPNTHHSHPATPARMNGRGGGGYVPQSPPRAGPSYQNFHPVQHHQPHFQGPPHIAVQAPHPQHHTASNPYSQSYPYPPPAIPYSPSWAAQQPISPLPKQLTMPHPRGISPIPPVYYGQPPPPQSLSQNITDTFPDNPPVAPSPLPQVLQLQESQEPPSPPPPPSSSYNQIGTISASVSSPASLPHQNLPAPSSPQLPSSPRPTNPTVTWAIWSRRPHDPSNAPGIIISPNARPPPGIVQQALELPTPPPSPIQSPILNLKTLPPPTLDASPSVQVKEQVEDQSSDQKTPPDVPDTPDAYASSPSQPSSTIPSSAATETTDASTVPGSPASTNTSVSAAPKEVKTDSALQADLPSEAQLVTDVPAPAAPVKKSWASLLRSSAPSGSSSTTFAGVKNTLPTSSVVGFSIPASSTISVPPSKKSELLSLLTSDPGSRPSTVGNSTGKICPRGILNTGNMCFANSVLQVLVYCPPFHRLFRELGSVLVGPVVGSSEGGTPLVDATVEFMKEFAGEDEKEAGKGKSAIPGSASGSGGKGKGKERENSEEREWEGEAFIPTYIYEAMKEKKRFDGMRGGHQEDAEEFLGFYLDTLEEELLSIVNSISPPRANKTPASAAPVEEKEEEAPPEEDGWLEVGKKNRTVVTRTIKSAESPITRIFGGKFRSTLRAPQQKDSVIVEDWRSLRLDIQREQIHTIEDALAYISHPQPVQVTLPSRPGVTVDASQQVLIDALPPILVLHMKRFCYDKSVGGVVKVGKQVRFGPELEIGTNLMAPNANKKPHSTRYKLFGVVYHHGVSAGGGHYTIDVLHPNRYPSANLTAKAREGWVRIDDELVSDVRVEDVFGGYEKDESRCAYLLCYRRVGVRS